MTDDLIERLRALPPPLPDLPDRTDRVRRRVVRRRQRMAVIGSVTVVVLTAAGTTVGLAVSRHSDGKTSLASPEVPAKRFTTQPGPPASSCPQVFDILHNRVPAPVRVDAGTRLVPPRVLPTAALVCSYPSGRGRSNLWHLAGRRTLHADLGLLVNDLTWLPPKLIGQGRVCTAAGGPWTNYLIALTYPGGGRLWLATADEPNSCNDSSNGVFVTLADFGRQVTASYAAGQWRELPKPSPSRLAGHPNPCSPGRDGRIGQETRMVPDGPTSVHICRTVFGHEPATYREEILGSGFADLVSALNGPHTKASGGSCFGGGTEGDVIYSVVFHYSEGPPVSVSVFPHCRPAIDNRSLQADDASAVVPLLERYFP
ncbi:MAG: hypothetical protein ACJ735_09415 [Actinomycetes bacterium]